MHGPSGHSCTVLLGLGARSFKSQLHAPSNLSSTACTVILGSVAPLARSFWAHLHGPSNLSCMVLLISVARSVWDQLHGLSGLCCMVLPSGLCCTVFLVYVARSFLLVSIALSFSSLLHDPSFWSLLHGPSGLSCRVLMISVARSLPSGLCWTVFLRELLEWRGRRG